MTPKENLLRLIEQLPADKLEQLERLAITLLPSSPDNGATTPARPSFEDALERVNGKFGDALKRLAQ